jgi:hypothetical protein
LPTFSKDFENGAEQCPSVASNVTNGKVELLGAASDCRRVHMENLKRNAEKEKKKEKKNLDRQKKKKKRFRTEKKPTENKNNGKPH